MKFNLHKSINFIRNIFILFSCLLTGVYSGCAQDTNISTLVEKFTAKETTKFEEKFFIRTDKNFYLPGEYIWFKIYVVEAGTHVALNTSRIGYVEIVDQENKVMLQEKISLDNGMGNGSFIIPSFLKSDKYKLRGYTNWMKNFSPDFYFEKEITIVNPIKRPQWKSYDRSETYDVQFFPEGGNMVNELPSKIGFRMVDQYGKGVEGGGYILDEKNDTVSSFHALHFGLGNFNITPRKGHHYRAITSVHNKVLTINLPAAIDEGYVMKVAETNKKELLINVTSSIAEKSPLYLLIHTGKTIKFVMEKKAEEGKASFIVSKQILGEGISHFTIFNSNLQPLCERLYFKKPFIKMEANIMTDKQQYGLREKVTVQLLIKDPANVPAKTSLSASVFLIDSLQVPDRNNIINYLWLTSDLKGTVESPWYYFDENNADAEEAADNLMLTQGWSRFKWEEVMHKDSIRYQYPPEYEGEIIAGSIVDKRSGTPLPNRLVYLSIPSDKFQLKSSVSNENGNLDFVLKDIYGRTELVLQDGGPEAKNAKIEIYSPYSDKFSETKLSHFSLSEKWKGQLRLHYFNNQVQATFLNEDQQKYYIPKDLDTLSFYGEPDKEFFLDEYTRFPTMEEVIREFVSKVHLRREGGSYHFNVQDMAHQSYFGKDPLVILDGVPIFDLNKIIAFDPLKIKKVDVIARKYIYGNIPYNGIVSYRTYSGDLAGFDLDAACLVIENDGLQLQREFFTPVYNSTDTSLTHIPDQRSMLFWSGNIQTNTDGKTNLTFYTSDIAGNYVMVVEGINAAGHAVYNNTIIPVQLNKETN